MDIITMDVAAYTDVKVFQIDNNISRKVQPITLRMCMRIMVCGKRTGNPVCGMVVMIVGFCKLSVVRTYLDVVFVVHVHMVQCTHHW